MDVAILFSGGKDSTMAVYAAIEAKFKTIYGNDYAGFEKDGAIYTKLRNGTYIFDCKIYADVKDAEGKIVKDSCFFTVTMD